MDALRDPKLSRKDLRALLREAENAVENEIQSAKKRSEEAVKRAIKEEERKSRRVQLKNEIGKLAGDASARYLYDVGVKNKKLAQIREGRRVAHHLVERTEPEWMRAVEERKWHLMLCKQIKTPRY